MSGLVELMETHPVVSGVTATLAAALIGLYATRGAAARRQPVRFEGAHKVKDGFALYLELFGAPRAIVYTDPSFKSARLLVDGEVIMTGEMFKTGTLAFELYQNRRTFVCWLHIEKIIISDSYQVEFKVDGEILFSGRIR